MTENKTAKVPTSINVSYGAILAAFIVYNSLIIVPPGETYVGVWFGTVQEQTYSQGMEFVNPMLSFHSMNVRQRDAEFKSASGQAVSESDVTAVSSNNLPMTIDVTYLYTLNQKYAWWVYRNIGDDTSYYQNLIVRAAKTATRNATAEFTDEQAMTSKRVELSDKMAKDFEATLVQNMEQRGLSKADAEQVFTVLPVMLSKILPPEAVITAISNKAAALQDLERQKTLTSIAQEVANRRAQEGSGVNKLFAELPKDVKPEQIAIVLRALAEKTRSDAELKAVESGKVSSMIISGGNNPVAVSPTP
ncbi:MAG: SPFH domain-containing protein [Candidatus Parcubacteria bacterium]|nr:SPFH domain-containing protein [Candidatus Parcubacteria bacterium]